MSEHALRYQPFADVLTSNGYAVYANDHRGHGKTAGCVENLGHFADENGWELVVEDMHELTKKAKEEYPSVPVFLLGHSMGSFLTRRYIQRFGDEVKGAILSGTGADQGLLSSIGLGIAKLQGRLQGKNRRSYLLNALSFGDFNRSFKPTRTSFDWLSRDPDEVDKYIADPYCGAVATAGFFVDLIQGLKQLDQPQNLANVPKDLSILLISGEKDPVGGNGKMVKQVYNHFAHVGIEDVEMKLYPEGRHEMFNEVNKEEVYRDVLVWMDGRI